MPAWTIVQAAAPSVSCAAIAPDDVQEATEPPAPAGGSSHQNTRHLQMHRTALLAMLAALAAPAGALAAPTAAGALTEHGRVLSVDRATATVQVVDDHHAVEAYRLLQAPTALSAGSVISFRRHGDVITGVRLSGRSRTLAYYATVVRASSGGLVLRLADGRTVRFASRRLVGMRVHGPMSGGVVLAHVASAAPDLTHLVHGATVIVRETLHAHGGPSVSITLPAVGAR